MVDELVRVDAAVGEHDLDVVELHPEAVVEVVEVGRPITGLTIRMITSIMIIIISSSSSSYY